MRIVCVHMFGCELWYSDLVWSCLHASHFAFKCYMK